MTRITTFLVVMLIIAFLPGRNAQAQERTIKSKYEFGTPELDAAQKLYSGRKYPEALAAFQSIIDKAQAANNWEELIYSMEKKALVLRKLGRFEGAISVMNKAVVLAQQELVKGHFLIAKVYYTRGTMDHSLRNFYSARVFFDTAMVFYNNANSYDSALYKRIVEYKYYAYQYSEGNQDTLLTYLDKLMELDDLQQMKVVQPNNRLILLQSYPTIYIQRGDFEQALAYAIRGYKYAKENRQKVSNRYYAEAQFHLARVLYYKKDYSRALKIGLEAMPLVESTSRQNMPEYYAFNNLLGVIYLSSGEYEKALPYFEKAKKIPYTDGNVSEKRNKSAFYAQVIMNMGICYGNIGENTKAEEYLIRSISIRKKVTSVPSPNFQNNYEFLGNFYFNEEDWDKAVVSYDSALRNGLISYDTDIFSFPENSSMTFSHQDLRTLRKKTASLKRLAMTRKNPVELLIKAKEYAWKTHVLLMANRDELLVTEGKLFLSKEFKSLYETGIDACFELYSRTKDDQHFAQAVEFAKQSKAILFLEQASEFNLVNSNFLSQETKERFFVSKSREEDLQKNFYELIDSSLTSDSIMTINEEILKARLENQILKDSIRTLISSFEKGETVIDQLFGDREKIKIPSGKALIEFFYGDEYIYVISKSSNKVSFQRIEVDLNIEESIQGLIETVSNPPKSSDIGSQYYSFKRQASFLYDVLLRPTLKELDGDIKHLILVTDEFLSRLPFEVLVKNSNTSSNGFNDLDYLIRSYGIQYELSTELVNIESKKPRTKQSFLGIGFKKSKVQENNLNYASLPGTEKEINFLKSNVNGTYLLGPTGTKDNFLKMAREYDILHLAIHGRADSTNRHKSSLIFNGENSNVLNTSDLYLAGLQARLAVLSACESGAGVINKGEGTFSIARGFALVGVPSLVMSLWKVNDQVSSRLMVDMYNGFINEGQSINEALRQSKLSYLEGADDYSSHPFYWAAFLQMGENVHEEPKEKSPYIVFILTFVLLIISLAARSKKRKRAV